MGKFIEEKPFGYTKDYKKELLDDTPVAVPLDMKTPEPLQDMIKRIIGNHFADVQYDNETETFEEADDFDVGDDYDPASPWEEQFYGNKSVGFLDQNRYQKKEYYAERNVRYDRKDETDNNNFGGDDSKSDNTTDESVKENV